MNRFLLLLLFSSPFGSLIFADTVFLKDGTQLKGEIIEDGPTGVTIEYFATPTIKDQRTVAKADVDRVEKNTPDQKDFKELGSLDTPATVTDTSFYDPLIDRKLPEFIAKYPNSALNSDACERLKTLTEERDRVQKGDRRLDSVWISASEIAADPYQTGALVKFTYIKAAAASNNPNSSVEALKGYELLEKTYPGSAVMPDAVTLALQQLQRLQSQLAAAKANGEVELKNFSNAIASVRADEAKNMKDAMAQYENNAKASMTSATADGSKFFPIFQKSKESIATLQALILAERARLSQIPLSTMREGIAAAKEGILMIKAEKIKEARDQLALSEKIWAANFDNTKIKLQIDQLEAKASSLAKQAATEDAAAKARKLAAEKTAQEAAEKAKKEAAELAAQQAAEKVAQEAAQKAALEAAKGAAGLATPTPTPSVVDKLNDNREIINVLSK